MIHQQSVHLKLDTLKYAWLCQESLIDGTPKNRIINRAVALYIRMQDARRRHGMYNRLEEWDELCRQIWGNDVPEYFKSTSRRSTNQQ